MIIPIEYDDISIFNDKLFSVKKAGRVGVIDNTGKVVISPDFGGIKKLSELDCYEIISNNKLGLMDNSGKILVDPVYDEIDCSNKRYTLLKRGNKIGFFINRKYIPADYDRIVFDQDDLGIIVVKKNNLSGFVTIYGTVVAPMYENISRFSPGGIAFVEKNGVLMFVDINGKELSIQEVTGGRRTN